MRSKMGSRGSKQRRRKVAPYKDQSEECSKLTGQPKPHWSFPALPVKQGQQTRYVQQKRTVLPPLKQEIKLSTLPEPFFDGPLNQKDNSSIIGSHPPRRPPSMTCTDEGAYWFSTAAQKRRSGTTSVMQGRFLDAQNDLTQKAYQSRRTHLRQAREQRRHKVFYSDQDTNDKVNRPMKLVTRPTQRDVFWDNTTGESLDPSCLLESNTY